MKERFLRIKSLGVISDSWLINNRGDQVHAQVSGGLNRKMVQDLSQRILQLFALQSGHVGPETDHIHMFCEELAIYAFDLGPLVLIAISQMTPEAERVVSELQTIADDFRSDKKFMSKYDKKGIERREMIADASLDEKARGLMGELKRVGF